MDPTKFKLALQRLFQTEDGQYVADMLKKMYINTSVFNPNSEFDTAYRLGVKEFVESLIQDSKPEEFVTTYGENND